MHTELINSIRSAQASEIEDILHFALERKRQLFSDWDILYLAIPKNDEQERRHTLEYLIHLYEK